MPHRRSPCPTPTASRSRCRTSSAGAWDFRDSRSALNGAGYQVIGLSPDEPEKLATFRETEGLTFPLLSDPSKEVLTAYGAYGDLGV